MTSSPKCTAETNNIHDEKIRAKIRYFTEKSKYFLNELKNLKTEKTMMLLESKKIRLEINRLMSNY